VYIVNAGSGVTVVDPSGDTVRGFVPINGGCATLCYDRTDDKVYVGAWDSNSVSVIDANGDSVVATVPVAMAYQEVCWNQNHDNAYVSSLYDNRVVVIDCTSDTILRSMASWDALRRAYSDSVSDKVYFADGDGVNLRILDAATYTFYRTLNVGNAYALRDNGRVGPANRLYCTDYDGARVTVVAAYKTDSILNRIPVGSEPLALAWNPAHSRMYVSNSGSSSITVIRDTLVASVDESRLQASSHKLQATVVRGVLRLGVDSRQNTGYRAELLDAAGRMVMSLKAGANDVSKLAPGVYFVRGAQAQAQDVRRVVITN